MSIQESKPYCGLKDVLGKFAKFVIVYEEKIVKIRKFSEFKMEFPRASKLFENKIQHCVKYVKCCDMGNIKACAKYTLFFVKKNYQVADLCRHLRNSFAHAHMETDGGKLFINDVNYKKQISSFGYLDKPLLINFLTELIKEYEESFTVSNRKRKCK
jgi:hypothetical protein